MSSELPRTFHLGEVVSGYLDGELTPLERRRAESHLAGCDLCRDELTDMMFVRARLRALPMLELPSQVTSPAPGVAPIYRRAIKKGLLRGLCFIRLERRGTTSRASPSLR